MATIVKCQPQHEHGRRLHGEVGIDDGRVQTGQLHRVDGVPLVGSLVDVRVKGDDAYAATSGRNEFMSGAAGGGVMPVL